MTLSFRKTLSEKLVHLIQINIDFSFNLINEEMHTKGQASFLSFVPKIK